MCARAWRFRSSQDDMRSILSVLMHTAYPDKEHTVQFLIWEAQKQQTFCCLILNITSVFISTTGVHEVVYVKRAVVWMNRQCRWAERRSWSVQKPIDLETRGCIQTVKELYREHSWHHQFHVHLFSFKTFPHPLYGLIPHAQSRLHILVKTAYLDFVHLHFLPVGAKNI